MIVFEFLPACHGDCFLVRWGNPERVMLIDGGPHGVFESVLRPRLMALPHPEGEVPTVDVLCISHVDDDHVTGAMQMLKELVRAKNDTRTLPLDLRMIWFNSVDELIETVESGLVTSVEALVTAESADVAVSASYGQGRDVRSSVVVLGLAGNPPFCGPLTAGARCTLHNMQVTVVGPSTEAVSKLAEKWRISVEARNTKAIAAAYIDQSVPNLSSIALHLCYGGRTALLSGDARGDHLLAGLEAVGLLTAEGTMHVDVFKLPHHGSEHNAGPLLFERIRADHYVICADGVKHKHPSTATLEWLVNSRHKEDNYTIYLTHPIQAAQESLDRLHADRSFAVIVGTPCVEIPLAEAVLDN